MPNTLAYVMLFAWPVLAALAFRRLPLPAGIAAAIVGGYLLLPTRAQIDLPALPAFDKNLSAVFAAFLLIFLERRARTGAFAGAAVRAPEMLPGWIPAQTWLRACLAGLIGGAFLTAMANSEPLVYGATFIRGIGTYDAFSMVLNTVMPLLPFLLAWKYLGDARSQRVLILVFALAAAVYMWPTLFEVRMSPQLNSWIYGFFPHSWFQHVRGGGFRPVVFLSHGLWLSLFLALGFLAALSLIRIGEARWRPFFMGLAGALFVTLVLSKSLGALMIALLFAPLILFGTLRVQFLVAVGFTLLVLAYPMLRHADVVPVQRVAAFAESIDPKRAASFRYRVHHEDQLLAKAKQKPFFGWGGWGRSRVYDERGRDISVTDGFWVITFGVGGWLRYLSLFGLLCLPVLLAAARAKRLALDPTAAVVAVLLTANLIDLIPNAGLTPLTWLLAGSLAGRLQREAARDPAGQAEPAAPAAPAPVVVSGYGLPRSGNPYSPVLPGRSGPPERS